MGPTWVLSAPDGPHVGPMNLAIREVLYCIRFYAFACVLPYFILTRGLQVTYSHADLFFKYITK